MDNLPYFLGGAAITVFVSLIAWVLGLPLSLIIAIARIQRIPIVDLVFSLYVSFVRSLPSPLLVMLLYFGLPVVGLDLNPLVAGIIAMTINTSAFNSEIWRSAILNFPSDQLDAARSVGMSPNQSFWRIAFPQIWQANISNFINEATFLVKSSPAVGIIGIDDLTRRAGKIAASNYEPLPTIVLGMMLYVVVLFAVSLASRQLERYFHDRYQLV
ncbi:MAG: amino acid ABC transporter permease [Myxacorys chilensis ATA2-1-KO14]|jgi:His/Glu/Gln/Arg/opine family amino acid ABC transporter permease subunit|nr:amino acid ABC transporter permease [Myxacorys chilensis ATA2-1-KO14]